MTLLTEIISGLIQRFPGQHTATHGEARIPLSHHIVFSAAGRFAYTACQGLVLVLIARLGNSHVLGSFILAVALTSPVFMLSNMGLRNLLSTEITNRFAFRDYWGLRLLTTLFALLVSLLLAAALVTDGHRWMIVTVAMIKSTESLSDTFLGYYYKQQRADRVAIGLLLRGASLGICVALGVAVFRSVPLGLLAACVIHGAILLSYDMAYLRNFESLQPNFDWHHLGVLLKIAAPLGIVAFFVSLALNAPRLTLEQYRDTAVLAGYGCCASFLQVFTMVGGSVQSAVSPCIARRSLQGKAPMVRLVAQIVSGIFFLGILIIGFAYLFGAQGLALVFGKEYAQYSPVLVWLLVAGVLSMSKGFVATGLTTVRNTQSQAVTATIVLAASIFGSLWLIPRYGIVAAAWVVVINATVSLAMHTIYLCLERLQERSLQPSI